ncbi:MAG TPA: imidazolonepropionase, partial [Bryobacterales bacterium]|nr:imidazolonepropionase [Bryobacterales bacterium]
ASKPDGQPRMPIPPRRLLIRGARQLLTLRGPVPRRGRQLSELGIIEDGSVLIEGDRIHSLGSARRMENVKDARGADEIDATGKVVMPGFVDSHTHFLFSAPRLQDFERRISGASYQTIQEEGGGIAATVRALRSTSPRSLEAIGLRWLRRFAACGTTTVEGKSGYGLNPAAEGKSLRVMQRLDGRPLEVVRTFLGAHVPPPEFQHDPDAYVALLVEQMLPVVRRRRLAEFCDVFCDQGAFTVAQARRILVAARSLGLGLKLHAGQFAAIGAASLGVELGAISLDHLEKLAGEELEAVAESETIATLLPGSVFHLGGSSYPPARRLLERGGAVALATDFNPGSSPTFNMQMILALACTQMKMTPAEAVSAATINGAAALGRAAQTGSLEPGKFADLILLDAGDYRELAYYYGTSLVHTTMRRGQIIWPARVEEPDL